MGVNGRALPDGSHHLLNARAAVLNGDLSDCTRYDPPRHAVQGNLAAFISPKLPIFEAPEAARPCRIDRSRNGTTNGSGPVCCHKAISEEVGNEKHLRVAEPSGDAVRHSIGVRGPGVPQNF